MNVTSWGEVDQQALEDDDRGLQNTVWMCESNKTIILSFRFTPSPQKKPSLASEVKPLR